jgi:hypothetical protein
VGERYGGAIADSADIKVLGGMDLTFVRSTVSWRTEIVQSCAKLVITLLDLESLVPKPGQLDDYEDFLKTCSRERQTERRFGLIVAMPDPPSSTERFVGYGTLVDAYLPRGSPSSDYLRYLLWMSARLVPGGADD